MVVYGNSGVFCVEAVGEIDIPGCQGNYYTLRPVYGSGVSYVPVDSPVPMREVMSPEEAGALIDRIPQIEGSGFSDRNPKALREHYTAFMKAHDTDELVRLIKEIYVRGQQAKASNRQLSRVEQQFMSQAEDLLYGELAIALGIPRGDVVGYITERIGALH